MRVPPALLSLAVVLTLATTDRGITTADAMPGRLAAPANHVPLRGVEVVAKPLVELVAGRWRKLPGLPCSARYPEEVTFLAGGVYLSKAGDAQDFAIWGGGDYELHPPNRIKLQIQTDAMVTYGVSAAEDELRFRDPDNCEFSYRRVD